VSLRTKFGSKHYTDVSVTIDENSGRNLVSGNLPGFIHLGNDAICTITQGIV
jgi:hypothetical protein